MRSPCSAVFVELFVKVLSLKPKLKTPLFEIPVKIAVNFGIQHAESNTMS